jgi:hypothetical protein
MVPRAFLTAAPILALLAAGCPDPVAQDEPPSQRPDAPAPLAVQQKQTYPEAVTGGFISLVDFEDRPDMPPGRTQVDHFSFAGAQEGAGSRQFALNITRTGAASMHVLLPRGAQLVYEIPYVQDFTGYTLLSASIYTDAPRDDLRVSLISASGEWSSPRKLLTGQWTTVLVDLHRLEQQEDFDLRNVEKIVFWLASPSGQLEFYLDDILLIDNRRRLTPTPPGMTVHTRGLELLVNVPHWPGRLTLSPGVDGLQRFARRQPLLELTGAGRADQVLTDPLAAMGEARIGRLERLEFGPFRLRLGVTWFFPSRLGEWVSLGIRRIRWEYTFYPDGRWVTDLLINNAGGPEVSHLRLTCPEEAALVLPSRNLRARTTGSLALSGPIFRCAFQMTGPGSAGPADAQRAYLQPAEVRVALGQEDWYAPGDRNRDRFDESQGCYHLRARNGYCRFRLDPPVPVAEPVIVVEDMPEGPLSIHADGLAIRDYWKSPRGQLIFRLPETFRTSTAVEISPLVPKP